MASSGHVGTLTGPDTVETTVVGHTACKQVEAERERALAETNGLLAAMRGVLAQPDFQRAAQLLYETLRGLLSAHAGFVALAGPDATSCQPVVLDAGSASWLEPGTLPEALRGVWADPCTAGTAIRVNEADQIRDQHDGLARSLPLDNLLIAPMRLEGETLGLICLFNKPGGFTEHDVDLAQAFADLAALALHHQRMRANLAQSDHLASMGMLAAGVAHEINNPLTYAIYNLQRMASGPACVPPGTPRARDGRAGRPDPATDEAGETLLRIRETLAGVERIRDIVRGLSVFSRLEQSPPEPTDLRAAVEHAISMARHEIKYRARLVTDFAAGLPPVMATEGRLTQVFLNLLINAAHAIEEGRVDRNEVRVRTWTERDRVFAEVCDTGTGIPEGQLDRIFEPFFTTKAQDEWSGLGLSICRSLVSEFGGEIRAASNPGAGTTFTIWLPSAPGCRAVPPDAPRDHAATRPAVRQRILVIDDDAGVRSVLTRILGPDHDLVLAASGEEAQAILRRDRAFDVVLCDVMMPRMSGMELFEWLARRDAALCARIALMTGGAFSHGARAFLESVTNPCIEKPVDAAVVRRVVDHLAAANRPAAVAP